jgi:iron complex transport system ATP-binding protein
MVVHDLNHATRHAHHLIALHNGQVAAAGPPAEVVTPALLRQVFGVEADVVPDPRSGVPLCIAYGLVEEPTEAVPRSSTGALAREVVFG